MIPPLSQNGEGIVRALYALLLGVPVLGVSSHLEVFPHRQRGEDVIELRDIGDSLGDLHVRPEVGHVFIAKENLSRPWSEVPHHGLEQRRFPRSIGSNDGDDLLSIDA